jgi:hypothetical protein
MMEASMEAALALIEQVIQDHKTILRRLRTMEQVANDAEALRGFEKAEESFMPGRFDQKHGMERVKRVIWKTLM